MGRRMPNQWVHAIAVTVRIYCPLSECDRLSPIPDPDGSWEWREIPPKVTCPNCQRTFRVMKQIGRPLR